MVKTAMRRNNQVHPFHLVDPSPWPMFSGLSALMLTVGFVLYMHGYARGTFLFSWGLFILLCIMTLWWRDVIREATFEGQHTKSVQIGLKLGVLLFIVSEIMFFFAFFWAFFHVSLNPSIFLGGVWPPAFLTVLNPWKLPLLNTFILLTSGATVTLAHHSTISGSKNLAVQSLFATIVLALLFTHLQWEEYIHSPFSIYNSVYGSVFFMLTGFHGFHVLIGTTFLAVCLIRLIINHFTKEHHLGFEAAIWYWHFVDVVWLFLFLTLYWWGS
jgi:cytochrome c oxidase subunit 3